ncbi:MAG: rhomboid family intramembrane serine protease [Propionibacteriaceae bacterium]|nr:rhomboid family intramembrane serine protease [Propionibacteriaceae bacterium]
MTTTSSTLPRRSEGLRSGLIVVGGLLALMWALEVIDHASFHALDQLGIVPRQPGSLLHIATAPWLHFGFSHLISNSIPFLVLGLLTWLAGRRTWIVTTLLAVVCSGAVVWLISPSFSITAGASGVVFGYLAFLLVLGFYTRSLGQILVAVVVFFFYGSVLLGVLPGADGVSWQGHLGGAIGGILSARMLRDPRPIR